MTQRPISYFADMVAAPLLAAVLSIFALTQFARAVIYKWCLLVMIGLALWTLSEYVIHRFIYHRVPIFQKLHDVHHANPRAYVGAPPLAGTSLAFLVSYVPLAAYSLVLANAISVGMLLGYTIYIILHHACHFWTLTPGGYLYRARLHHAVHHYRNDDGNFGVTSSIWDRVFGTRVQPSSRHSLANMTPRT